MFDRLSRNRDIWLMVIILSILAYVSISQTSASRDACDRGNLTRSNQKYVFRYNLKTAEVVSDVSRTEAVRGYFEDQVPKLKRKLHQVPEVDCHAEYKYLGVIK